MEIVKSRLKLNRVDFVHHISDVHIRNYKRHQEYNRVFEDLYRKIKTSVGENHLILLTGDIVHSKTDVTPELFNEVQKFLSSLCDIAPVLMIPGNHDANLNNTHRLDALTPIVNALNHDRLEYIKESCVLRLRNVDFYHWSVFDPVSKYPQPFEDSQIKIALYHGSVNNCLTEAGFRIENEKVSVETFSGFDLVMLGDIHKTQFLNLQKTIAYPGSLIQQNHGEGRQHGYLLWEVNSRHVEFVEVQNDTAFYTLEVDSGSHAELDETLPKNIYLRVRYKNTDQATLRNVVESVKKKRNIVEVATQRINSFSTKEKTFSANRGQDFRSVEQQNKLITDFLKRKHSIKDEDLVKVLQINEEVNKSLKKSEVPRNSMWIPKRFEFDNMFSYGKGNYVDFTDMKGVHGMFAPNASGKSTLLDSLTFCLFDKCSKTNRGHQVMNATTDKFYCKLNFELNGLDYYIERKARKQSNANVRVEVDFYYIDENGDKVSMNGKDRSDTNANIRNLLGTYEDFVLTTLSTQSNNTGFIDMNQKDRKDLLSQFMDIGVFEELNIIATESCKETAAVLKHYQKTDYEAKFNEYQQSLEENKKLLEDELLGKKLLDDKKEGLNSLLVELATRLQTVDTSIVDESSLKDKIKSTKHSVKDSKSKKKSLQTDLDSLKEDIKEIEDRIKSIDDKDLEEKVSVCLLLKDQLHELNLEYQNLENHVLHKDEKLGKLKELEYDPDCEYCMNNVFVKDAISAKEQIAVDRKKLSDIKKKREKLEEEIAKCNNIYSVKNSYDSNQKELSNKKREASELSVSMEKLNSTILKEESQISDYESKLQLREKQLSTIESNERINLEIVGIKKDLVETDHRLKAVNSKVSELSAQIKVTEKSLEDTKKQVENRKNLESSYSHYQHYLEATHRDGIPHDIISVTIPQIEEEVNNILSQLVDFKIIFETDDKNVNAYIAYSEEKFWPLELTSGMEKFVSSLAIRTSLINISTLPRPNFLAVDEGFGTLDKSNLGSMSLLFEYLKTQFKFLLVISHIDSMRDLVDDHIEIHKVDGKSSVKFG